MLNMIYVRLLLFMILLSVFSACSGERDARLSRVDELSRDSLDKATVLFATINRDSLSKSDCNYYDLLTIKLNDKRYVVHTSDSLIRKVMDYAKSHKDDGYYPEALYYGGRVYADIGDYPTALRYFNKALDELTEDNSDMELYCRVLSQTGRLLDKLRLYDQAIPFIERVIDISREKKDTLNEIYDLQLLGAICLRDSQLDKAEQHFLEALDRSVNLRDSFKAKSLMYLAAVKYYKGKNDSALKIIRGIPDRVSKISRQAAMNYAAQIYYSAGILDTAYMYALEIVNSKDNLNKRKAYKIILSSEFYNKVDVDTLIGHVSAYRNLLESEFNANNKDLALMQQAEYNYIIHERERKKAENLNENLIILIFGILIVGMFMVAIVLYKRNKLLDRIIILKSALDKVNMLSNIVESEDKGNAENQKTYSELDEDAPQDNGDCIDNHQDSPVNPKNIEIDLRNRLRKELLSLASKGDKVKIISPIILQSAAYAKILEYIKADLSINDDDLWIELENAVLDSSPQFKERLNLLTFGQITQPEFRTCLLIKCGVRPSDMAKLCGRSIAAIGSRRDSICCKIFDEKMSVKIIDKVIRLL